MNIISATVINFKEDADGSIYCNVRLSDECGGGVRNKYIYLCPPHALIKPYIGMPVKCYVTSDFGLCVPITRDFTKLQNMQPGDVLIGNGTHNVIIKFTKEGMVIKAPSITVESESVTLNVAEITATGNITTTGNITGALITGNTDVQSGQISLQNHKHISGAPGSPTGPATP